MLAHMAHTTQDALEVLREHIVAKGMRMTRQRQLIAEVMLATDGHVNIDELYQAVQERDESIGYATIYRTLKLLTDAGLTHAAHFGDGRTRFEAALNREHHDHMICENCDLIIEFENEDIERLQEVVARQHRFRIRHHKMELYGTCQRCQS